MGIHETSGIEDLTKVTAVTESARLNICIHGLHETGITTCAANKYASTLPNLDDGIQYMSHLQEIDILKRPDLTLFVDILPTLDGPGLSFEIHHEVIIEEKERYIIHKM